MSLYLSHVLFLAHAYPLTLLAFLLPDGKIKLSFSLTNDKQMTYQVTVNDTLEIIMAKGGGQAITFIPAS